MVTEVRTLCGGGGNGIWVLSEKGYKKTFQNAGNVLYLNLKVVVTQVYTHVKNPLSSILEICTLY